jgi:hypothetical protein
VLTRLWRHVDLRVGTLRLDPGETKTKDGGCLSDAGIENDAHGRACQSSRIGTADGAGDSVCVSPLRGTFAGATH